MATDSVVGYNLEQEQQIAGEVSAPGKTPSFQSTAQNDEMRVQRQGAAQTASGEGLCSDGNEDERAACLLSGGITDRLLSFENDRLEYISTFFDSQATVAGYFTQLLAKLQGHVDAVQLESCDVNMLGHFFARLAAQAEFGRAVADQADYILQQRKGGRL
jgi:hypothetical protein